MVDVPTAASAQIIPPVVSPLAQQIRAQKVNNYYQAQRSKAAQVDPTQPVLGQQKSGPAYPVASQAFPDQS